MRFRTYGRSSLRTCHGKGKHSSCRISDDMSHCLIWKACRATSAAPTYFESIEIEEIKFVDGGLGFNNPAREVLHESRLLKHEGCGVRSLVSIGTGIPSTQTSVGVEEWKTNVRRGMSWGAWAWGWPQAAIAVVLGITTWSVLQYMFNLLDGVKNVSTSCERVHNELERESLLQSRFLGRYYKYLRFNLPDAKNIELDEADRQGEVMKETNQYLRGPEAQEKLEAAVKTLSTSCWVNGPENLAPGKRPRQRLRDNGAQHKTNAPDSTTTRGWFQALPLYLKNDDDDTGPPYYDAWVWMNPPATEQIRVLIKNTGKPEMEVPAGWTPMPIREYSLEGTPSDPPPDLKVWVDVDRSDAEFVRMEGQRTLSLPLDDVGMHTAGEVSESEIEPDEVQVNNAPLEDGQNCTTMENDLPLADNLDTTVFPGNSVVEPFRDDVGTKG